ncbi:mitochondrial outer membrane protein porin of 34 kDa [Capsicum annuum]|nr:mitochondrial outer membrane protein porin of 34 kDa [Capsicum annuum]
MARINRTNLTIVHRYLYKNPPAPHCFFTATELSVYFFSSLTFYFNLSIFTSTMDKVPGLYSDIGKKARDLLYKGYHTDHKFSITSESATGVVLSSSGLKKDDLFLADVNAQLKNKNITTDIKVDSSSNLFTTITLDEAAPGLKTILSFRVPDQQSGKLEVQYLHDYVGISTSIGLTANPIVNFSGLVGTNVLSLGTDVSFDTKLGAFSKYNAGLSFTNDDLVVSVNLNDKGDTLSTSFYRTLRHVKSTAVGMEVSHSFSTNEKTFTTGTQYQLDELTTIKTSLNNFGKATALLQHQWRPNSLFTLSGEIDTKAINKGAKYGLAVALKP